jgi:hypothetical protein
MSRQLNIGRDMEEASGTRANRHPLQLKALILRRDVRMADQRGEISNRRSCSVLVVGVR